MYEKFYGLRERPFGLTPDPAYLYLGGVHQEALDYLRLGIESSAGFVVVTGDVGCGKTMLLQTLLGSLDRNAAVARLVNTLLEPKELLEAILIDFGMDPGNGSKPVLLRDLARFLVQQRRQGQRVLVVIDEAQNLRHGALEELRMLSNLETEKSKLIQIVLVGQPELRDRLQCYDLEQLRQRIPVRHHLGPLDAGDTGAYINHRLRVAAAETPLIFGSDVTNAVYDRSAGVPRTINVICDAILLAGYSDERESIDAALAASVFDELEKEGVLSSRRGPRPWAKAHVDPFWVEDHSVCETEPPVSQKAAAARSGRR